MKSRTTVNALKISYDEETDIITFEKKGVLLPLKMGEDNLNLLYQMTPYLRYKKFLMEKQKSKCAKCKKSLIGLPASKYALHHDPKLGSKGAMYMDFNGKSKNRILCKECHDKI
jgi:hypothetical protein